MEQYRKPVATIRQRARGKLGFFILDRGEGTGWKCDKENKTYLVSLSNGKSCNPKSIGKFLVEGLSMVEVNNFLFLFAVDSDTFLPVSMRYDPSNDEWLKLAPGPVGRKGLVGSSVARLGDNLYQISGMHVTETSPFRLDMNMMNGLSYKVFKYNIATNDWTTVADFPKGAFKSAASGCPMNGCVYVTGGYSDHIALKGAFAYDAKADIWLTKPSMNHGRLRHSLELVNSHLYAIGGRNAGAFIETFDIVSEQWTDIEGIAPDVEAACSVVKDDAIFILGGTWKDGDRVGYSSAIRVLHTKSEKLETLKITLPQPMNSHACGLVIHPKFL